MMAPVLSVALMFGGCGQGAPSDTLGYLWPMRADSIKEVACRRPESYTPAEGDLLFFTSRRPAYKVGYGLAGTGEPWHVCLIVRDPSGELVVFDFAPPGAQAYVASVSLADRFDRKVIEDEEGYAWVRRLRRPVTAEESATLTNVLATQSGKKFSPSTIAAQVLPGTRRLTGHFDPPRYDKERWICSELVVFALQEAGLFPATKYRASRFYPRDLMLDEKTSLSCNWATPMLWSRGTCPP